MFLLEQIILIQTFNRNEFWWIRQWHYLIASCKNLASIFPKSQWQVVWVKPWLQRRSTKSAKSTRLLWLLKPCVENMFVWVGATHFFLFVVLSLIWLDLFFEKILRSLFSYLIFYLNYFYSHRLTITKLLWSVNYFVMNKYKDI